MISVCILTKNCEATLKKTLDAIRSFSEVILLDNGSNDSTLALAAQFPNVRIYTTPFIGFGPLRNLAARHASNDWIFALDSDEIPSPALLNEIASLVKDPQKTYSIQRHNFFNGKQIKGCGWSPDRVIRIYHKKYHSYSEVEVHESIHSTQIEKLTHPLLHTPYRSTDEFLIKMQHYSTLFAKQNAKKKRSSFACALTHGVFAFIRSYFLKRGICDGKEGFIISLYNANTAFYKYLKLAELNSFRFKD